MFATNRLNAAHPFIGMVVNPPTPNYRFEQDPGNCFGAQPLDITFELHQIAGNDSVHMIAVIRRVVGIILTTDIFPAGIAPRRETNPS